MDKRAIIKYCKELGCCDACCIRYLGHRNPEAFENTHEYLKKLLGPEDDQCKELKHVQQPSTDVETTKQSDIDTEKGEEKFETVSNIELDPKSNAEDENSARYKDKTLTENTKMDVTSEENFGNGVIADNNVVEKCKIEVNVSNDEERPTKRARRSDDEVCFSCIGILQEQSWPLAVTMAHAEMERKGYECSKFACALSPPVCVALREKVVTLRLKDHLPDHKLPAVTPLKEAWKWSFCGPHLAPQLGLTLESGAVADLLLTFSMDYANDAEELRSVSVHTGCGRIVNRRELESSLSGLRAQSPLAVDARPPTEPVVCRAVLAAREPIYIGGRYIKLSRSLPQTPWCVRGERVMPSSVQEVMFSPLAAMYGIPPSQVEGRLKLLSAGREDVDVRCLGRGRPFAIEIVDPRFTPTEAQLSYLCQKISEHEEVKVKVLRNVSRSHLVQLKQGEETKLKSYQALCIKLRHTDDDIRQGATPTTPVRVSPVDIERINSLTPPALAVNQRTPLRVLHRRPLHTRRRELVEVRAHPVPDHPQLLTLQLVAQAGTYIKEWVHGEVGRTSPSLCDVVPLDILALDVTAVQLEWPPN